jgi:hypothetical protein
LIERGTSGACDAKGFRDPKSFSRVLIVRFDGTGAAREFADEFDIKGGRERRLRQAPRDWGGLTSVNLGAPCRFAQCRAALVDSERACR